MSVPDTDAVTAPPPAAIAELLGREFPSWDFLVSTDELGRARYTATARQLGTHPHTFSTTDPARMRGVLGAAS